MAAEAARVLGYDNKYYYGSAAPAREIFEEQPSGPVEYPLPQEKVHRKQREIAASVEVGAHGVSMFAVFGSIFAAVLMIFVVLAQISYNEIASDTVRLNAQLNELTEQQRRLEITFESVIDMKEVERYARDVLGMSSPEADQMAAARYVPSDRAEVIEVSGDDSGDGLGSFVSSLLKYFK